MALARSGASPADVWETYLERSRRAPSWIYQPIRRLYVCRTATGMTGGNIYCDEVLIVSDIGRLMAGGRSPCCPDLVFYLVEGWVQINITPGWRRALMDILRQDICRRTPYTACFVIGGPSVLITRQRAREDQVGIDLPYFIDGTDPATGIGDEGANTGHRRRREHRCSPQEKERKERKGEQETSPIPPAQPSSYIFSPDHTNTIRI